MGRRRDRGCPCGLPAAYDRCCGRFLTGAPAPTAELLMRSRDTACARHDEAHPLATWHASTRLAAMPIDPELRWTRPQGVATAGGGLLVPAGEVHFRATNVRRGVVDVLEERSRFAKQDGRWTCVGPAS